MHHAHHPPSRRATLAARLFLSLALLHAGLAHAAEPHSALVPVPRDGGALKRHEELNRRVATAKNNIDLAFVGDSITQGWEGEGAREIWEKFYGSRRPINLGIGGDRTQHVLWRLENGNADGIHPKVTVLMIGTNNSGDDRNSAGEIVDGIRAVVAKLHAKWPDTRILLLGIFPRGEDFNPQRGKIAQVNQAIARLDNGTNIRFLDIASRFLQDNGRISKEIMPDFLHLSPKGYTTWAEAMEPTLVSLLGATPTPTASSTPSDVISGTWSWTMNGPSGEPVTNPLLFKVSGQQVTGTVNASGDRQFPIEQGTYTDGKLRFVLTRKQGDDTPMVYSVSAALEPDGTLRGEVQTTRDGSVVKLPWTARRN